MLWTMLNPPTAAEDVGGDAVPAAGLSFVLPPPSRYTYSLDTLDGDEELPPLPLFEVTPALAGTVDWQVDEICGVPGTGYVCMRMRGGIKMLLGAAVVILIHSGQEDGTKPFYLR